MLGDRTTGGSKALESCEKARLELTSASGLGWRAEGGRLLNTKMTGKGVKDAACRREGEWHSKMGARRSDHHGAYSVVKGLLQKCRWTAELLKAWDIRR